MSKLELLLEKLTGALMPAPVAAGVGVVQHMECGAVGDSRYGTNCETPSRDDYDDRDYDNDDSTDSGCYDGD